MTSSASIILAFALPVVVGVYEFTLRKTRALAQQNLDALTENALEGLREQHTYIKALEQQVGGVEQINVIQAVQVGVLAGTMAYEMGESCPKLPDPEERGDLDEFIFKYSLNFGWRKADGQDVDLPTVTFSDDDFKCLLASAQAHANKTNG